jgi:hypothetical protein
VTGFGGRWARRVLLRCFTIEHPHYGPEVKPQFFELFGEPLKPLEGYLDRLARPLAAGTFQRPSRLCGTAKTAAANAHPVSADRAVHGIR